MEANGKLIDVGMPAKLYASLSSSTLAGSDLVFQIILQRRKSRERAVSRGKRPSGRPLDTSMLPLRAARLTHRPSSRGVPSDAKHKIHDITAPKIEEYLSLPRNRRASSRGSSSFSYSRGLNSRNVNVPNKPNRARNRSSVGTAVSSRLEGWGDSHGSRVSIVAL